MSNSIAKNREILAKTTTNFRKRCHKKLLFHWEQKSPWFLKIRFYFNLIRLVFKPLTSNKRILGIWDYKALPWSVGDPMVFVETLSVLKLTHNAGKVDLCIIYDKENPVGNRGSVFGAKKTSIMGSNINRDNATDYMMDFLPIFGLSPFTGSIFQFNSRNEFYNFIKGNGHRYYIYPSLKEHLGETFNYYGGAYMNKILDFYKRNNYVPSLKVSERETGNSYQFYKDNLPEGAIPVTLSFKLTTHDSQRNPDTDVWLAFIDKIGIDFPEVVFVIIGLREESFDGLRARPNVIIAKDFGTNIIEDVSLISASVLYMATTSGIGTIARFSELPYLIFQEPLTSLSMYGVKRDEQYCFSNENQKVFDTSITVTPELLYNEFKNVFQKINLNKWRQLVEDKARGKNGHPTAVVSL